MNPYRAQPLLWTPPLRRARKQPLWPWIGPALLALAAQSIVLAQLAPSLLYFTPQLVVGGLLIMTLAHLYTSAVGRLCRLTWRRGDRLAATMLFIGVGVPKYSQQRLERNRAALAVVVEQCRRERQLFR